MGVKYFEVLLSWIEKTLTIPVDLGLRLFRQKEEKPTVVEPSSRTDCEDSEFLRKMSLANNNQKNDYETLMYLCKKRMSDPDELMWGPHHLVNVDKQLNNFPTLSAIVPPGYKTSLGIAVFMGICAYFIILLACVVRKYRGTDIPIQSASSDRHGEVLRPGAV